jgi:hypothetical protein
MKWSSCMEFEAPAGYLFKKKTKLLLEIHLILRTGRRINQSPGEGCVETKRSVHAESMLP